MKLLVTRALTIDRVYYAEGTVAEFDDSRGGSLHRQWGWTYVDEDGESSAASASSRAPASGPVLAELTKPKLKAYAKEHGIELPAKATKGDILEILEG